MDSSLKAATISLVLLLNGCATLSKSILLGAAVGGVAGGTIGQAQNPNLEGTALGLAIGAGLGSLIGYFGHREKVLPNSQNMNASRNDELSPFLTKPKIKSYIVPDTIEGNRYIKSHRIFILEDAGSWSKENR